MSGKSTINILVAEDNIMNQRLIELLLGHLGYSFKIVRNGRECCEEILRKSYRLVLMDLNMPELDGFEATQFIRQSISAEEQPFIMAVTASNATLQDCLNAGMDGCISKPIDLKKLRYMFSVLPEEVVTSLRE